MSDCAACQPNVEGIAHTCDEKPPAYQRTGIRVKLGQPPYALDLDSFEVASADVASRAHELRMAAMRLKRAAEERERVCAEHEARLREFMRARNDYAIAESKLSASERGDVLPEIKVLPLPEGKS